MSDELKPFAFTHHSSLITHHFLRNDDPQRARKDSVVERRRHHVDLAVRGDGQALGPPGLDPNLLRAERVEVLRLPQPTEERAHGEPQKAEAARAVRDVEAQASGVEALARADLQALHPVLVVADEDEGSLALDLTPVGAQAHAHERVAAQDRERRAEEGRPLAAPAPLAQLLAPVHDARVEAEARIVDEDLAVDLAHVDRDDAPLADAARGLTRVERDFQVLREVVERAEREHAERTVSASERRSDRADRAVASASDDRARAVRDRAPRELRQLRALARDRQACLDAARGEGFRYSARGSVLRARARRRVDDDLDGRHRDLEKFQNREISHRDTETQRRRKGFYRFYHS